MCGIKQIKTTHKPRSHTEDLALLVKQIMLIDPWNVKDRKLKAFANFPKSPFTFQKEKFEEDVMRHAKRLFMSLPLETENEDEEEECECDT